LVYLCKCDIRETTYELKVAAALQALQAYDELALARGALQHCSIESLQSVVQKIKTFVFPLLSHLHYILVM
jgi:hypothetical protein